MLSVTVCQRIGDFEPFKLERMIGALSQAQRSSYELAVLPGRGMQGLQSREIQQELIDTIVSWMGGLFAPYPAKGTSAPVRG
jgi:hypothetical protein